MKRKERLRHGIAGISLAVFIVLGLASAATGWDTVAEPMLYGIGTELCLDDAIRNSAAHLANGIGSGARVAVVSMESGSARMSNYLVDGMIDTLIDIGGFGVVNTFQVDLFAGELQFTMSELDGWNAKTQPTERVMEVQSTWENVSPEGIAQGLGRFMGVQFVIMGTFERFGDSYRFRTQVIGVETAAVQSVYTVIIR